MLEASTFAMYVAYAAGNCSRSIATSPVKAGTSGARFTTPAARTSARSRCSRCIEATVSVSPAIEPFSERASGFFVKSK